MILSPETFIPVEVGRRYAAAEVAFEARRRTPPKPAKAKRVHLRRVARSLRIVT